MQKSHAVAFQDVAGRLCLGQRNRTLSLFSQPIAGKAAEPAASIAGAGNGEMADPGAAISQGAQRHFPDGWGLCDAVGHCLLPTRPVPCLIGSAEDCQLHRRTVAHPCWKARCDFASKFASVAERACGIGTSNASVTSTNHPLNVGFPFAKGRCDPASGLRTNPRRTRAR